MARATARPWSVRSAREGGRPRDERQAGTLDGGGRARPERPGRGRDRRELGNRVRGGGGARAARRGHRAGLPGVRLLAVEAGESDVQLRLQRRLAAAGAPTAALAAHPGVAFTGLTRHIPGVLQAAYPVVGGLFTQSAAMGALPILRAATDPSAAASTTGPRDGPRPRSEERRVGK